MKIDEAQSFAIEVLAVAESAIDKAIAKNNEFGKVAALFLARARQALASTVMLAANGLVADAMSVTRTIFELDIDLAYIRAEATIERIKLFSAFEAIPNFRLAKGIAVLHDGAVKPSFMEILRERSDEAKAVNPNPKSPTSWAGIDIGARASKVGRDNIYNLAYREACGASHSGMTTLRYVVGEDNKLMVVPGPAEERPIGLACMCMLLLATSALDVDDDLHEQLRSLSKRLSPPEVRGTSAQT